MEHMRLQHVHARPKRLLLLHGMLERVPADDRAAIMLQLCAGRRCQCTAQLCKLVSMSAAFCVAMPAATEQLGAQLAIALAEHPTGLKGRKPEPQVVSALTLVAVPR